MAIEYINTGTSANSGDGDSIRAAFNKVNNNFSFLSTASFSVNTSIETGPTAPSDPNTGDLWYDTVSGRLYIYYDASWVDTNPAGGGGSGGSISTGSTPPVGAGLGDLWYDTNSGRMYIYYDSGWVDASPPSLYSPNDDTIYNIGEISGAVSFNRNLGSVQTCVAVGSFSVSSLTGMTNGRNLTLIITQGGSGANLASFPSSFKFAGGSKTLSTVVGAVDMINMVQVGTTTFAVLSIGYQ